MDLTTSRNHYGILIVLITFLSRVIFVGFCWSYGTIIVEFKKQNTTLSDTEMSWIGSIGQSFGGLLAPGILLLTRRFGYQHIFILSLVACSLSLLVSSLLKNFHWLLLIYSMPYGFANTAIYLLGTLLCGLYYPATERRQHVLVMCIISTGFPIGYHVMSAFIFSFLKSGGWQSMQRRIGLIELAAACVLGPLFTAKFLSSNAPEQARPSIRERSKTDRKVYYSMPVICWMLGIFTAMCSISNFLLHLHSHLESLGLAPARADLWFRLHGLFDALFRLLLPVFVRFYPVDIIYLFPISVLTGFVFLTLIYGLLYTSLRPLAILPIVLFSFTSAVTTALQYTVSNRLFEDDQTEQGYVYHTMIMSLGAIIGPVLGGRLRDLNGNYNLNIPASMLFLVMSFIFFNATILLSNRKKMNESTSNPV